MNAGKTRKELRHVSKENIAREYAMLLGRHRVAQSILFRGLFGRLKWALFGK